MEKSAPHLPSILFITLQRWHSVSLLHLASFYILPSSLFSYPTNNCLYSSTTHWTDQCLRHHTDNHSLSRNKSYEYQSAVELYLVPQLHLDTTPTSSMPLRVAVVGGGASGLVTLKHLVEAYRYFPGVDIQADLFDANDELGGVFKYHTYESAEVRLPSARPWPTM